MSEILYVKRTGNIGTRFPKWQDMNKYAIQEACLNVKINMFDVTYIYVPVVLCFILKRKLY